MTTSNDTLCRRLFYLPFLFMASLAISPLAMTETNFPETLSEPDAQAIQILGEEILQTFSDVRDDAEVQDATGTRAVNHWYADGRFISRWTNGVESGEVTGTWRVEGDLRCIKISSGLPQRVGEESCGPVFRRGNKYLSFNSDGSVHGVHALSPLLKPSK